MSEDVLEAHPEERSGDKGRPGPLPMDQGKDEAENSPGRGEQEDQREIDQEAEDRRKMAVMGRHGRDPIKEDAVKNRA